MKIYLILIISFLTLQVGYAQNDIEVTFKRRDDNSVQFNYTKKVPGTHYLKIEFTTLENCNESRTIKKIIKHNYGSLLRLRPVDSNIGISFSYNIKYIFGNPKPRIKKNITYAIPVKEGKSVEIFEASNFGEKYFGSEKPKDWKSFIINSNRPDTVYSMRKGTVVEIINNFDNEKIRSMSFTSERNIITVEHKDGTYATYKGFKKDEIFVKLGQKIYPHTTLGIIEKFNNNYRLDFNIFHYLKNLLDENKSTLSNRIYNTKFLNPNFLIDNETRKIKSGELHTVSFNEEIKLLEFSRREKRKYKKKPNKFK